jgi:cytoskeletal protein CcmA (bactofilin family)
MAANIISQISTSNTFQQWLGATQSLISTANLLTNGNGDSFIANTRIIVGGVGSNVSLNVETSATINDLQGNSANVTNVTTRNLTVTSNVETLNVTTNLYVGDDLIVYKNANIIGDLTVSGNLTLDALGFDDLSVSGSGSFGNTLSVTGTTTLSNLTLTGNVATLNVTNQANFGSNVRIDGDLTVSGNITLDEIGFDDLQISGSANIANNLTVHGVSNLANANVAVLSGSSNNLIFIAITEAKQEAVAFAIALG